MSDKPMHTTETLPSFYRYQANQVAAPAEMRRLFVTPRSGSVYSAGSKIEYSLQCGQPGIHLDPSQSAWVFTIRNGSSTAITLDGGAHSIIDQIDVTFGSQTISTTRNAAGLYQLLSDFQVDPDSLRSSGSMRGVNKFDVTGTFNEAAVEAAYTSRAGVTIAAGASATFALPLICALGTLAQKAIPLSALLDMVTLEIRLAPLAQWGVFGADPASQTSLFTVTDAKFFHSLVKLDGRVEQALYASLGNVVSVPTLDYRNYTHVVGAGAGNVSWQIPHKSTSATAIFITVRAAANVDLWSSNTYTKRTRGGMQNYRFMIGSEVVPQSAVICTNNAIEARLELSRAFGEVSDAAQRSCIDGASYAEDGFCIGLNMSAFPRSSALSDGISTRNLNLVFEATLDVGAPQLRLDAYICSEVLLVAQEGLLSIDL